jgi:hypothetical protein
MATGSRSRRGTTVTAVTGDRIPTPARGDPRPCQTLRRGRVGGGRGQGWVRGTAPVPIRRDRADGWAGRPRHQTGGGGDMGVTVRYSSGATPRTRGAPRRSMRAPPSALGADRGPGWRPTPVPPPVLRTERRLGQETMLWVDEYRAARLLRNRYALHAAAPPAGGDHPRRGTPPGGGGRRRAGRRRSTRRGRPRRGPSPSALILLVHIWLIDAIIGIWSPHRSAATRSRCTSRWRSPPAWPYWRCPWPPSLLAQRRATSAVLLHPEPRTARVHG